MTWGGQGDRHGRSSQEPLGAETWLAGGAGGAEDGRGDGGNIHRRSHIVQALKVILPVMAMVIGAIVIVFAITYRPPSTIATTSIKFDTTETKMLHPRFTGRDDENRAFVVVADAARKKHEEPHLVLMDQIKARVIGENEPGLLLTAISGVFETEKRFLELTGDIQVRSSDGYNLATEAAEADLNGGVIKGDKAIVASGPIGELRADRFWVFREQQQIRFEGNVRVEMLSAVQRAAAEKAQGRPSLGEDF